MHLLQESSSPVQNPIDDNPASALAIDSLPPDDNNHGPTSARTEISSIHIIYVVGQHTIKMFRSAAVLRSAASAAARRSVAATTTSRSFSSVVSRPTLASRVVAAAPVSRVAGWNSVRCYAAGSGLSKEDVEGRITSLLAGFDKVRLLFSRDDPGAG